MWTSWKDEKRKHLFITSFQLTVQENMGVSLAPGDATVPQYMYGQDLEISHLPYFQISRKNVEAVYICSEVFWSYVLD